MEQPSDSPLGEAPNTSSTSVRRVELQDEEGDTAFAIWCLLEDYHELSTFVHNIWLEYCKGDVSLQVAGLITDTAFGIMRRANEDFVAAHPSLQDYWHIYDFLGLSLVARSEHIMIFPK